ncbi:hypothetical protein DFH94DRAFT_775085 [Russula ochroleuca]|uniref:Uncharacterized protein n=1 Tax=Russula ochroleuca TaxID=152965 RepID=A0A9P5MNW2_9AGAM|nr:hypothetical protein DFH94DRAFT_775085 [Russula ochroleuca]
MSLASRSLSMFIVPTFWPPSWIYCGCEPSRASDASALVSFIVYVGSGIRCLAFGYRRPIVFCNSYYDFNFCFRDIS